MKDIVIFSGATWSVLSLCKYAYTSGARAYVVNMYDKKKFFSKSKFVYKEYNVTLNDLKQFWADFFIENHFKEKPILYFAADDACSLVAKDRDFYESHFELCLPSNYIINTFIDKTLAHEEAKRYGLTVPMSLKISSTHDLDDVKQKLKFPIIIKPIDSSIEKSIGFKFQIVDAYEKFYDLANELLNDGKIFLVQEYIPGDDEDYKFYIFFRDSKGNIRECMGEKTIQRNGIMTVGTTLYDAQLSKISRIFLDIIDYVGIGGIEYKRYDNKYYFIEMSVRTEGFLGISDLAHVSLSEVSYNSITNGEFEYRVQENGVKYICLKRLISKRIEEMSFFKLLKDFFVFGLDKKSTFIGFYIDKHMALIELVDIFKRAVAKLNLLNKRKR